MAYMLSGIRDGAEESRSAIDTASQINMTRMRAEEIGPSLQSNVTTDAQLRGASPVSGGEATQAADETGSQGGGSLWTRVRATSAALLLGATAGCGVITIKPAPSDTSYGGDTGSSYSAGCTHASDGSMTTNQVKACIRTVFGSDAGDALKIANCESSDNSSAISKIPVELTGEPKQYARGLFQFIETTWDETPEGKAHPVTPGTTDGSSDPRYNAEENIKAAKYLHDRDGNWHEWACASIVGLR